jgi:hypothetical protein
VVGALAVDRVLVALAPVARLALVEHLAGTSEREERFGL